MFYDSANEIFFRHDDRQTLVRTLVLFNLRRQENRWNSIRQRSFSRSQTSRHQWVIPNLTFVFRFFDTVKQFTVHKLKNSFIRMKRVSHHVNQILKSQLMEKDKFIFRIRKTLRFLTFSSKLFVKNFFSASWNFILENSSVNLCFLHDFYSLIRFRCVKK